MITTREEIGDGMCDKRYMQTMSHKHYVPASLHTYVTLIHAYTDRLLYLFRVPVQLQHFQSTLYPSVTRVSYWDMCLYSVPSTTRLAQ